MDKKILLICLIAIVAFSISCVSAADSNEIVMNSSDAIGISEDISVDDVVFANQISSEDSQVVGDSPSGEVWVATTGSDDNDGSQANPVSTIAKAIELAGDGYTIHIADGNYVNDKTLSISKSLTLEGSANTVIDGNAAKIMEVTADATVVLTNLSFTNGNAALVGAISNEGKLTISNSNFYSNKATGNSGTIITN